MDSNNNEPVKIPIDGILDLHTFRPKEVKDLIPEYLHACHEKGIFQVRIIHGKGSGVLRSIVHSCLSKMPGVKEFHLADPTKGGWGVTIVNLLRENR